MFTFVGKMLLPLMIKLIRLLKLYKLKLLTLLKLLKRFLYIAIVFRKLLLGCIPPHSLPHPGHFPCGTSIKWTVNTSIFELLNNCSRLEAMFLPAALDVTVFYFVDSLCVFLRMRVV
jgi:hypothetical protein